MLNTFILHRWYRHTPGTVYTWYTLVRVGGRSSVIRALARGPYTWYTLVRVGGRSSVIRELARGPTNIC